MQTLNAIRAHLLIEIGKTRNRRYHSLRVLREAIKDFDSCKDNANSDWSVYLHQIVIRSAELYQVQGIVSSLESQLVDIDDAIKKNEQEKIAESN